MHASYRMTAILLRSAHAGGSYKASSVRNFPGSTKISGALFVLHPGGLREQHWHNPNEWATVGAA